MTRVVQQLAFHHHLTVGYSLFIPTSITIVPIRVQYFGTSIREMPSLSACCSFDDLDSLVGPIGATSAILMPAKVLFGRTLRRKSRSL